MLLQWAALTHSEFTNLGDAADGFRKLGWVVERVLSSNRGLPKTNGVYLLVHLATRRAYVGSNGNLYARPYQHNSLLNHNAHWCQDFQDTYNTNQCLVPMFIVTETREQAYDLEQKMLDQFLDLRLLFNTAKNARLPGKDAEVSFQTRLKISNAGKGRPQTAEWIRKRTEHRRGVSLSKEAIEKMRQAALARGVHPDLTKKAALVNSKKVTVDGVVFNSIRAVKDAFGISGSTVIKRINSANKLFSGWSLGPRSF